MKDEYLSRLVNGGQIGRGQFDYNLSRLIGDNNVTLSPDQKIALDKIWTQMSYNAYTYLDDK